MSRAKTPDKTPKNVKSSISKAKIVPKKDKETKNVKRDVDAKPTYEELEEQIVILKRTLEIYESCVDDNSSLIKTYKEQIKERNEFISNMLDNMKTAGFVYFDEAP